MYVYFRNFKKVLIVVSIVKKEKNKVLDFRGEFGQKFEQRKRPLIHIIG